MERAIVFEKIKPPLCDSFREDGSDCRRPASYRILKEERPTFFLCGECFSRYTRDRETQEIYSRNLEISAKNTGLFSSIVRGRDWRAKKFSKLEKIAANKLLRKALYADAYDEAFLQYIFEEGETVGEVKYSGQEAVIKVFGDWKILFLAHTQTPITFMEFVENEGKSYWKTTEKVKIRRI